MIFNMCGGGGTGVLNSYAVIGVTYPSGAVCTCKKDSVVYTAHDTSGYALFAVPEAGAYTIKIVKGSDTSSTTAVVNKKYQCINLTIAFTQYIFKAGSGKVVPMTLYSSGGSGKCTSDSNAITIASGVSGTSYYPSWARSTNKVKIIDNAKTLRVKFKTNYQGSNRYLILYVASLTFPNSIQSEYSEPASANCVAYKKCTPALANDEQEFSVNVSSLVGQSYYVGLCSPDCDSAGTQTVSNLWFSS